MGSGKVLEMGFELGTLIVHPLYMSINDTLNTVKPMTYIKSAQAN